MKLHVAFGAHAVAAMTLLSSHASAQEQASGTQATPPATAQQAPQAPPPAEPASAPTAPPAESAAPPVEPAAPSEPAVAPAEPAPVSPAETAAPPTAPASALPTAQASAEITLTEPEPEPAAEPSDGPGTLLGGKDGKTDFGGYGGVSVHGSWFNDQAALLLGMEGGFLLDHRLVIGLAGYGVSSEVSGPRFQNGNESVLGLGYGGLMLRYQFVSDSPIYPSLGLLVGGGAMTLLEKVGDNDYEWDSEDPHGEIFFVAEPSLQLHANFTRWMRMSLHASYRFVGGVDAYGFEESDIRGVSLGGNLQFGWF